MSSPQKRLYHSPYRSALLSFDVELSQLRNKVYSDVNTARLNQTSRGEEECAPLQNPSEHVLQRRELLIKKTDTRTGNSSSKLSISGNIHVTCVWRVSRCVSGGSIVGSREHVCAVSGGWMEHVCVLSGGA